MSRHKPSKSSYLYQPCFYNIVIMKDNDLSEDFGSDVLQKFFNYTACEASEIIEEITSFGAIHLGVYTREVAETIVQRIEEFSRNNKVPFQCIMQKDKDSRYVITKS